MKHGKSTNVLLSWSVVASSLFLTTALSNPESAHASKRGRHSKTVTTSMAVQSQTASVNQQATYSNTATTSQAPSTLVQSNTHRVKHKRHHKKAKQGLSFRMGVASSNSTYQANAQTSSDGFTAYVPETKTRVSQFNVVKRQSSTTTDTTSRQTTTKRTSAKPIVSYMTLPNATRSTTNTLTSQAGSSNSQSAFSVATSTAPVNSTSKKVTSTSANSGSANVRANIIQTARQYLGDAYVYGATGENNTFDCSGLTQKVYAENGVTIPRVAQDQYNYGQPINEDQLQPGDLVFFGASNQAISHVGIYIGNGQMLDAQDNGVVIEAIHAPWWNIVGYAKLLS